MPTTTSDLYTYQSFRDLVVAPLFEQSHVLNYVTTLQTDATYVTLPTVSGGAASWRDELEDLGDAGIIADEIQAEPQKLAVAQIVSSESVDDAGAAAILGQQMATLTAQALDLAFFRGGTKAPAAITSASGVQTIDAVADLDGISAGVNAVETAGGTPSVVWVSPTTWGTLSAVKTQTGSNQPVLVPSTNPGGPPNRAVAGVPVAVCAGVPDDQAVVADGNRIVVVLRRDGRVEVDRSVKFLNDAVAVRLVMRVTWAAPYPGVIAVVKDVAASRGDTRETTTASAT
jgi:HK97 family phage major capsid protein